MAAGPGRSSTVRSRLVCYSLLASEERLAEHALQFELSVASLRAHSPSVPVALFVQGDLPSRIESTCRSFGVLVHWQGPYEQRLRAACPVGAAALARYPVLHKNMNFGELVAADVDQALCCDLDTLFFDDVEVLLDRYVSADVVAREEVFSRRSVHGVDPTFIDEGLVARVADALGRRFVPPFNLGMVLYSRRAIAAMARSMPRFVDDVWRLCCGLALGAAPASAIADASSMPWIAATRAVLGDDDAARALPYPSSNPWIVEEVALWLTLGALPGLVIADLSPRDVAQNGEMFTRPDSGAWWLACHYYSHNLRRVVEWLGCVPGERGVSAEALSH